MVFFCSSTYDLAALGRAIKRRFSCPVVGCTTAGEILAPAGYMQHSVVGVGFATSEITLVPMFIPSLTDFVNTPDSYLQLSSPDESIGREFGLLLIDGLSMLEERTVAAIHQLLRGRVPLIGGSAGDGLDFKQTAVYHNGKFYSHAATLAVFSTSLPFKIFQFQHFTPTETKLVITEADVATRSVSEINGLPAAAEYARIVGRAVDELSPTVFAAHPVMLKIGGEYYVRSIQTANVDGSLTFYCAIDIGLVLTLATSEHLPEQLSRQLVELVSELPNVQLILGCDCILRRLELERRNDCSRVADILAQYPFIGFSTYGEQFGGIHMNQTLTGLAIGAGHDSNE
ncbi:MAG: FIST C-terminal domain-containing protein [Proteobacteria bacterium]|nr:FIST C-terminal domain-containing protein [Pseudomonadota bacterium]